MGRTEFSNWRKQAMSPVDAVPPCGNRDFECNCLIVTIDEHFVLMLKVEDDGLGSMQRHYGNCKDKAAGGVIRFTRTFVLKQLSISVERADEMEGCYRTI